MSASLVEPGNLLVRIARDVRIRDVSEQEAVEEPAAKTLRKCSRSRDRFTHVD